MMASLRVFCGRSSSLLAAGRVSFQSAKLLSTAAGSESTDVVTHTGQVFLLNVCYDDGVLAIATPT